MFVIIMDVLKYGFGIDPIREDREYIRRNRRIKKHKRLVAKSLKKSTALTRRSSLIEAML